MLFRSGDFGDLKKLIDWAAKTHQQAVQILPINDTTITHTWMDSYPYNSISIYAFHPMYIDLNQLGKMKDKEALAVFEARRQELNALPQIDYEAVNNAKRAYLKVMFQQTGRKVLASAEFKKFFEENEHWLLPYAAFSYLRDLYGTPDFSQWPETFVSGIVALFIAQKRYGIKLQIVSAQEVKFYLKDSIPFFSSTFLMRAYKTMNTLVLGFILGDFAVGLYTAAEKLHNAYSSFVSPLLSQIFYPYFTRIKNMGRATKMVLLLCIANTIALACIYFLSPYLIPIFIKTETASITTYFNLFLLLLAISVPADMFGFPYLGVLGKINEVNMTTIYSAIIYIIVVLVLILTHSISIGSVIWALIIANVGCLVLRLYLANKVRVGNVDKQ